MSKSYWQLVKEVKQTELDISLKLETLLPSSKVGIWKFQFQILKTSVNYTFHFLTVKQIYCQKDFEKLSSENQIDLYKKINSLNQKLENLLKEIELFS